MKTVKVKSILTMKVRTKVFKVLGDHLAENKIDQVVLLLKKENKLRSTSLMYLHLLYLIKRFVETTANLLVMDLWSKNMSLAVSSLESCS